MLSDSELYMKAIRTQLTRFNNNICGICENTRNNQVFVFRIVRSQ